MTPPLDLPQTAGMRWFPAYVGLGSNLDRPAEQVEGAIEELAGIDATRVVARSSLYRSAPLGGIEQPEFVNAAVALLTRLDAPALLVELHNIERRRGRVRDGTRWGPRVIDLDLLVYSDRVVNEPDLILPHPGIAERNFVLLPLTEIAPELRVPGVGRLANLAVDTNEPEIERIAR